MDEELKRMCEDQRMDCAREQQRLAQSTYRVLYLDPTSGEKQVFDFDLSLTEARSKVEEAMSAGFTAWKEITHEPA
jgi:hypothetical protein